MITITITIMIMIMIMILIIIIDISMAPIENCCNTDYNEENKLKILSS